MVRHPELAVFGGWYERFEMLAIMGNQLLYPNAAISVNYSYDYAIAVADNNHDIGGKNYYGVEKWLGWDRSFCLSLKAFCLTLYFVANLVLIGRLSTLYNPLSRCRSKSCSSC